MSSAGASGGGGGGGGVASSDDLKRYFCHQCSRTFTLSAGAALACIHCRGDFIEESDAPNPNPEPYPDPYRYGDGGVAFFGDEDDGPGSETIPITRSDIDDLVGLIRHVAEGVAGGGLGGAASGGDPSGASPAVGPGPEPLVSMLQDFFQTVVNGGGDIQLTLEGAGLEGGLLGRSIGDYFVGPGLERLIEQLAENDPNRYGTPPASKTAVEALPDVKVSEKQLNSDEAQCSVCMDTFELGVMVKQMPCKHVFHKDCILPWLELHNSCPVCRFELPTDDPDYESRKVCVGGATNSGDAAQTTQEAATAVGEESAVAAGRRHHRFGSNSEDDSSDNGDGSEEPDLGSR